MSPYQRLAFPALRRIDPRTTHDLTLHALGFAEQYWAGVALLQCIAGQIPDRSQEAPGCACSA